MAESEVGTVAQAVLVTAEVMGGEVTDRAAEAMARELVQHPPAAVIAALKRCQRELSGRLTLAEILKRLDDGHPGPEEAWAIALPAADEDVTVVWTHEIAAAFGAARELLLAGDRVAARMAFRESYTELLREARERHEPPAWWPALGQRAAGRHGALLKAVQLGRLSADRVRGCTGHEPGVEEQLLRLEGKPLPALPPPDLEYVRELTKAVKLKRIK